MKRLIIASFLTAGLGVHAQSIGNSPYAAYGIGEVKYDNTIDHSSMGGISTAYIWDFNNQFNFRNPAANQNFDLTSFKVSGTNENNFYKSDYNNMSVTKHSTYLSNISIAFPLSKKLKFGLGYQPYSSKKYNINTIQYDSNNNFLAGNSFRGDGTLNTVQAALGYSINPNFSVGLRTNFYFGKLHDIEEVTFQGAELVNGFESTKSIKNFNFTLGSTYQQKLKNNRKMTFGATYTFGSVGTFKNTYTNSTYYYYGNEKAYITEIERKEGEGKNFMPQEFSLGAGYGHDTKWFVSSQIDYKSGKTVDFLGQPFVYKDAYKVMVGGWYLPNYNNFRNYFSRVIYRYGAFYEKGSLYLNNTNINQYGISLGASLPFQRGNINRLSTIDLGLELGKRGTTQNNLISQTFINLKVGINFADKWFEKRLYD